VTIAKSEQARCDREAREDERRKPCAR
jgi:hypothetical protein